MKYLEKLKKLITELPIINQQKKAIKIQIKQKKTQNKKNIKRIKKHPIIKIKKSKKKYSQKKIKRKNEKSRHV